MKNHRIALGKLLLAVSLATGLSASLVHAQLPWAKCVTSVNSNVYSDGDKIGMILDNQGNCFVTGWFDGMNDFGGMVLTNKSVGGSDIFVAKYNSSGALQWACRAGGTAGKMNKGRGIGIDANGNVYVTGVAYGAADFGSSRLPDSPDQQIFLASYDSTTGTNQRVQSYQNGEGLGLAVDGTGNLSIVGFAGNNSVLLQCDSTGNLNWTQPMYGPESYATKVAVDLSGNAYVAGTFTGTTTIETTNLVNTGAGKGYFLAKFDAHGNLTWVDSATGGGPQGEAGVAVDQAGNVYVAGLLQGTLNFGGISLKHMGTTNDAFLAKYSSSGALLWAREAGGTTGGTYADVALDGQGNVYAAGGLAGSSTSSGSLVVQYSPIGAIQSEYPASTQPPAQFKGYAVKCAVDAHNGCYLAGWYSGSAKLGSTVLPAHGLFNFFLAKVTAFVNTNAPTLTISNPNMFGEPWTNWVFSLAGTAKDKVAVTNVSYSLNGGAWTNAVSTNNWTNWSSVVTLTPGTNTIAVYALNAIGNASPVTNTCVFFVVSNQLQIHAIGLGTIAPNYSNAWLNLGQNYSITSSPASGFSAGYWVLATNGLAGAATAGKVVHFMMASNLTLAVNFVDTNRPTVSITNLVSGQRVSNAVCTVKGKATDNWQVAAVNIQLNNNGWTTAAGSNNWSALLNLVPGTNTVQAYAVDNSGNVSLTNSVKINYVLSAPLMVRVVGAGSVTPNYNGALLAIGTNYTMKATASNGFAFYYWGGGVTMTTNKSLTFTMASNLTIVANFADVTKPVATITYPTANLKWSDTNITVTGKASDNVGVAEVWCQINGGGWILAQTGNGFTNWIITNLPVILGTNILQAYAVDAAGNVSVTAEVKFSGKLSPAGMALIPAGAFTMGDPLDGDNWSLPLHTVNASDFFMDSNLVSYSLWQQVYNWAIVHGYSFDDAGYGAAGNQPVLEANWYDCVKWCNARSEMTGLAACYYADVNRTAIYRSGDIDLASSQVSWAANGYRLPTEAEWEKAARGGLSGKRFPWGNTISENQANYYGCTTCFSYDLGPSGSNPVWGYSPSPVGSFVPNGYGLYDMAGNVWEWCWDWAGDYSSTPETDPHGPASSQYGYRILRGGSYYNDGNYGEAFGCRCEYRLGYYPSHSSDGRGFRCVRGY